MAGPAALALLAAAGAAAQDVRVDAPIPHVRGQSVSPSFEGWYGNPDGTRSLVFGYFNRNYDERLDIPVGPDNRFEPGSPDRGSPPTSCRGGRRGCSPWSCRPTSRDGWSGR